MERSGGEAAKKERKKKEKEEKEKREKREKQRKKDKKKKKKKKKSAKKVTKKKIKPKPIVTPSIAPNDMESVVEWNGTVDGKEQTRAEGVTFTYRNVQYVVKDG